MGLPYPVAIAVALVDTFGAALARRGAGQPLDLQFHQPLGREADPLAQRIAIDALFALGLQGHRPVGRRRILGSGMWCGDQNLPQAHDDQPRAQFLHHDRGQDRAWEARGVIVRIRSATPHAHSAGDIAAGSSNYTAGARRQPP